MNATDTVTLRTAIEPYGYTTGIINGTIASPRLRFDVVETKPIVKAFAPMANEQAYDVAEMAIVTFIQAFAAGKPVLLLPALMLSRFHHASIWKAARGPIHDPADLNGKRIGVRSYTQTTGVWVRGILHAEYGVDLDSITNVTTEGGHIKEYVEPSNVVRAPADVSFRDMLVNGEIDAWIAGRDIPPDAALERVVEDVDAVEAAWFERTGAFPINHMLVMRGSLLDAYPWIAAEFFTLLETNKDAYIAALRTSTPANADEAFRKHVLERGGDPLPFGVEALRPSLQLVIDYALAQKLIPRRFSVDELFDPRVRELG